jgi:hypothetical protein
MARIIVETDRGAATLSEKLVSSNLQQDDYAEKLIERVAWALTDAETSDGEHVPGSSRPDILPGVA